MIMIALHVCFPIGFHVMFLALRMAYIQYTRCSSMLNSIGL